jgi:hypothetical protein
MTKDFIGELVGGKYKKGQIVNYENNAMLKDAAINEGRIPVTCTLRAALVWWLILKGEDPCAGCNWDREVCKGRPKSPRRI